LTAKRSDGLSRTGSLPSSTAHANRGSSLLPFAGHRIRSTRKASLLALVAIFEPSVSGPPVSLGASHTKAVIYTYMDSSNQVRLALDVPLRGIAFSEGSEFPELSHQTGLTK